MSDNTVYTKEVSVSLSHPHATFGAMVHALHVVNYPDGVQMYAAKSFLEIKKVQEYRFLPLLASFNDISQSK